MSKNYVSISKIVLSFQTILKFSFQSLFQSVHCCVIRNFKDANNKNTHFCFYIKELNIIFLFSKGLMCTLITCALRIYILQYCNLSVNLGWSKTVNLCQMRKTGNYCRASTCKTSSLGTCFFSCRWTLVEELYVSSLLHRLVKSKIILGKKYSCEPYYKANVSM